MKILKLIYADNAATTQLDPRVRDAMLPYLDAVYGNPSSPHSAGRETRRAIEGMRKEIEAYFGGSGDIYFTSGGTESNNWAIKSALSLGIRHVVTGAAEHHSVLNCCKELEKAGIKVTYVRPNAGGIIEAEAVEAAITPETGLVSIMYANNETGTVQAIPEISEICRRRDILLHSDAVQALGHMEISPECCDMISFSAHKFYGPKGTGGLYVRKGLKLPPLIHGGEQESGRRSGTENIAGIAGMAKALALIEKEDHVRSLRDELVAGLLKIEGSELNGHRDTMLPGIANISFKNVNSEALMLMLDLKGICVSAGAACTSASTGPSHVLTAMGLDRRTAESSVRFSLGRFNNREDVAEIISAVTETVEKLRKM